MSDSEFDYLHKRINECAIDVRDKANDYKDTCTQETLDKIKLCYETLEKAGKMLERVDKFIADDDGEESFNERWIEDKVNESNL